VGDTADCVDRRPEAGLGVFHPPQHIRPVLLVIDSGADEPGLDSAASVVRQAVEDELVAELGVNLVSRPGSLGCRRNIILIGINGAAAHLIRPADLVTALIYAGMSDAEARLFQPRIIHVDADNGVVSLDNDEAGDPADLSRGDVRA
jgi:hypothetical protein